MPSNANSLVSTNTRAELNRVANVLNKIRLSQNIAEQAHIYLRVGNVEDQADAVEIEVSSTTLNQIAQLIEKAGAEDSARVHRRHEELSTQKAANLLGVSRPYLVKLLDAGEIPYRLVGRYRRVRRADVEQFERENRRQRRAGLEELAAFTQEIGLDY